MCRPDQGLSLGSQLGGYTNYVREFFSCLSVNMFGEFVLLLPVSCYCCVVSLFNWTLPQDGRGIHGLTVNQRNGTCNPSES